MNIEEILGVIEESHIDRSVLMKHDEAFLKFRPTSPIVADQREFGKVIGEYVQHHLAFATGTGADEDRAYDEARRILQHAFQEDPHQDGYNVALEKGLRGKMLEVIDALRSGLKSRSLEAYLNKVFNDHVNPLSAGDARAFCTAYFDRYRKDLEAQGYREEDFLLSARAVFDYLRKTMGMIGGIGTRGVTRR